MTHEWFRLGMQSACIVLVLVVAGCSGHPPQNQIPPQSQTQVSPQECLSEQANSSCFYKRETAKKNEKIIIFVLILFIQNVSSLGITPAIRSYNFEPGMEITIGYNILSTPDDQVEIFAEEGELSKYVSFDKKNLKRLQDIEKLDDATKDKLYFCY